jgi:anti-sigma regulatory factor (Ser/Thr protein kinase)
VNEIASNSLLHGGGRGVLRVWRQGRRVVCEIRDRGRLDDPLADRDLPSPESTVGRGLWIANQLCDLVQIRSFPTGTVVRLHMASS